MSEEKKAGKLSFLDNLKIVKKIKQNKHIGLIVVVIFVLILLLILFSDFNFNTSKMEMLETSTYSTYYQYAETLENKLKNVLGKIKGVGNIEVMVSLDNNSLNASNSNTSSDEQSLEILPNISGVVIVSSGASDINVKLNLLTATQTLLDIAQNKIQIYVGN
ncbi:MAG: hypothetical protein ACI4TT_00180 [Christensenellales bacterium]